MSKEEHEELNVSFDRLLIESGEEEEAGEHDDSARCLVEVDDSSEEDEEEDDDDDDSDSCYREQAKRDCEVVYRHVQSTLKRLGRNGDSIPETHVKTFCRNAPFLQLIRGSSLSSEYSKRGPLLRNIDLGEQKVKSHYSGLQSPELYSSELESGDSELSLYILLRASERFLNEFGRYPGALDGLLEADIAQFKKAKHKQGATKVMHIIFVDNKGILLCWPVPSSITVTGA
ncbi:unnamed protein product [Darwinula stevensoni]|uniref:Uncharacterized protein n=1 Tax=Darwinula stevensoni TaxID=69355 RepID=A0A7R8WZ98_9CRUS|nr:unnamed protein product [Darwinula stevensoni]CAG0879918.1 unnamed protein product [Darwinula stevensoni]